MTTRAEAIKSLLERPFDPRHIHWRVGATNSGDKQQGIALAYLDARDVMRRLDQVCGLDGWQCNYSGHAGKSMICNIGIKIGDAWLWRANGAGATDIEAEKGQISDAFKRAAVMWGIGRYLYSLPNIWVPITKRGKSHVITEPPQLPGWATPEGWDAAMAKRAGGEA